MEEYTTLNDDDMAMFPWCEVIFDCDSYSRERQIIMYLRNDCGCQEFAFFESRYSVCLFFQLPPHQEQIFLDWIRDETNLTILRLKKGLTVYNLRSIYLSSQWNLECYDSKTVAEFLDHLDQNELPPPLREILDHLGRSPLRKINDDREMAWLHDTKNQTISN